jgi:hypothetical protein
MIGRALLVVTMVAGAGLAGYFLGARPDPGRGRDPTVATAAPVVLRVPAGTCSLSEDDRELLRRAADRAAPSVSAAPATPTAPTPTAAADPQAHRDAVAILDRAASAGVWTPEDDDAFRRLLGLVGDAERNALLSRLATSINAQTLHPTTP